jgi:hypothetical protein
MSDTPRLPHIGKYMRDRYADDLEGEKRAMVEAQLKLASDQDLQKIAGPSDWFKSVGNFFSGSSTPKAQAGSAAPTPKPPTAKPKPTGSPLINKAKTQGSKGFGKAQSSEGPLLRWGKKLLGFDKAEKSFADKTTVKKPGK